MQPQNFRPWKNKPNHHTQQAVIEKRLSELLSLMVSNTERATCDSSISETNWAFLCFSRPNPLNQISIPQVPQVLHGQGFFLQL